MTTAVSEKTLQNTVLLMVLLNAFTTPLTLSAANVALPTIADDLVMSAVALGWVPMAYLMASAMFVLPFGGLADRIGRKRVFLLGTAAVIASSVMAALAMNAPMLLTARFLQGVSAAMLYATQLAIVSSVFPAQRRGQIVGLVVSSIYVGLATGPLLGGLMIDLFGWRSAFLLQVPLAIVVLLIGVFKVNGEWSADRKTPFDSVGAMTYSGSILLLCLAVSRLPAVDGLLLLAGGTISMLLFVRHALRIPFPIWDIRLFFTNRVFTLSCAASLIMYSATYANVVLISLFLQYLKGMSASQAGMIMMLQPLCMAVLSPLTGRLSDRIEPRVLASVGMAVTALGLLMLARLDSGSSVTVIVLALLMTGAGFALFSSPNVNAIMGSVLPQQLGSASGAVATTRLLGQLTSMVLVSLMLTMAMGDTAIDPASYPLLEQTIRNSFGLAAALCIPGILLSMVRGRIHTSTVKETP
ncbi:MAG: MFS transporter [Gammaproteobacteria bacterium]|nr:MFS transporter [Gammaproteobacteria bacterium]MDP2139391.1 MFS transporter [Gammaproteobacteria bacterium]MDP2346227.1 MFS transporter [Gammaproteobacteria bacterium]